MTEKIKVAFVGGGVNSAVGPAHYASINIDNNFELVSGFFSRNERINYQTAERYDVNSGRVYNSIENLIVDEKSEIDAVIILTPTNQHASHVEQFIRNNIPVICEKALAGSLENVNSIKKVLEKKAGFLSVIYNYLGYPMVRELKHLIETGELGEIKHIQIEMPQESFAKVDEEGRPVMPQQWRLKDDKVPTISLDLGVHLHMFIKYLTGEQPLNVIAKSESFGNFSSIVDNVNCIIEYTNHMSCNMWYSKMALGKRNGLKIRIYGDLGAAEWLQMEPEVLHLADNKSHRYKLDRGHHKIAIANKERYTRFKAGHPAGFIEAFANYYQDVADALVEFKAQGTAEMEECFGINEAYEGIQLFEAIQKSSMSRSWEKVEHPEYVIA